MWSWIPNWRKLQDTTNTPQAALPPEDEAPSPRPFAFLDNIDADELAHVLESQHPQATAIVIAHLTPQLAADVLAHLSPTGQSDALMRIARLSAPHPDVIRDLELEMQNLLAHCGQQDKIAADGLASVEAILHHASPQQRRQLVVGLSQQDRMLVRQLRVGLTDMSDRDVLPTGSSRISVSSTAGQLATPHPLAADTVVARHDQPAARSRTALKFSELERLDNAALARILRRASPNTTLLAVAGASHDFVQRILGQLPSREAGQLDRKIHQIGPLRLDDVQRAQQQLVDIAQQLMDEGKISLPGVPRFAVAA